MKGIAYYRPEAFNIIEIKTCSDDLHAYKKHLHQELSIGYIQKGETTLSINGEDHHIKAGEAVAIYPYVSHECQPVDIHDWAFTMIYIDHEFCKGAFDDLFDHHSIKIKKLNDESQKIKYLSDVLQSNVNGFDKEVELINILNQLFNPWDRDMEFKRNSKINSIKTYIEEHFLEDLQLKDMEEEFNVNKFSLIRNFKSRFNTTPNAYQLQLKVDYGKHLLRISNNIADIALKAGFYDQAHFAKEFKKSYGITPLQYHKAIL